MDFRSIKVCLGLILFFGHTAGLAWAHGGGVPQLTGAEAGPYRVSVWTQPSPIRVGETHFTVAVTEPAPSETDEEQTGAPILGATVELQFISLDETEPQTLLALATHETAVNKLFYEADVELPAAGQWQVAISVEGSAGSGNTSFEIEVAPASGINWILFGGLGLVLLAIALATQKLQQPKNGN